MKKGIKDPNLMDLIMWAFLIFGAIFMIAKYGLQQQSAVAQNYAAVASYNDIMDASFTDICSRSADWGIAIINTPQNAVLNRQNSFVQVSGGDSGTFNGDRILYSYVGSICFSTRSDPVSRCYDNVAAVSFDGIIPKGDVSCQISFHLDFTAVSVTTTEFPTTTTTTLPNGGIFTPDVIGVIVVIIMLVAGLIFVKSR